MKAVKVLVCGSRSWPHPDEIYQRVAKLDDGTVVIHGAAAGADSHACQAAWMNGLWAVGVPVTPRHWAVHGRSAGFRRNIVMLDLGPDLVVAFQRNGSLGTQHTIDEARRRGIKVELHTCP